MPSKQSGSGPSPLQTYGEMLHLPWSGLALAAAVELDLFSHIAAGRTTAEQVAEGASTSVQGTRRLLDALCGMGYLKKSGRRYKLQSSAAEHLVRGKPLYMGDATMIGKMTMGPWSMLAETVKSGRPLQADLSAEERQVFFSKLVPAIFAVSFCGQRWPDTPAGSIAAQDQAHPRYRRRSCRMVDPVRESAQAGAGHGGGLPVIAQVTRRYAERLGVGDRFDYLEGDFREVDFGTGFDLAILGHIIHGEGPDWGKRLLKRTCEAVRDGGMLLIGKFVPNDEHSGPALPLLFGLNMVIDIRPATCSRCASFGSGSRKPVSARSRRSRRRMCRH